uniref:aminomethyltransferase, mitochondrial-like n=1 Tax=Styela clava TaxID=7725 RepID=UPI001939D8B0|nr:aminomethyltransferase, mitochondrial-like [Styela clava]
MPVQYKDLGLVASHHHTREKHHFLMCHICCKLKIFGKDRIKFIESLIVGDIQGLENNSGTLSLFTNDKGGILDDVIVNVTNDDHLYIVSNAGCGDKITALYNNALSDFKGDARIEYIDNGLVALQGPLAAKILQNGVNFDLSKMYFMKGFYGKLFGVDNCRITRCGYTGEDGFEISIPKEKTFAVTEKLLENEDVKLAGLGARDSLRLEAGLCLYGNDMDETTTPVEASLTWCIGKRRRKEKNFPGAEIILQQIKKKPEKRRVGLVNEGPTARSGASVFDNNGAEIGCVTSGCPSPTLQKNIAMAYVPTESSKIGTLFSVQVRKKVHPAKIVKMPFTPAKYYFPAK